MGRNATVKGILQNFLYQFLYILPVITVFSLTLPVAARDPGGCFMVDSAGRTISLGSLCGNGTPVQNTSVFRVPIKRRIYRTPVVDVTFNGNRTFEMIVDTGASATLINQNMASALQLQPANTIQARIADGTQIELKTGIIRSVGVGGIIANNIEVAIAPKAEIGLLGHDFFGDYDVKIREKFVEFHRR